MLNTNETEQLSAVNCVSFPTSAVYDAPSVTYTHVHIDDDSNVFPCNGNLIGVNIKRISKTTNCDGCGSEHEVRDMYAPGWPELQLSFADQDKLGRSGAFPGENRLCYHCRQEESDARHGIMPGMCN